MLRSFCGFHEIVNSFAFVNVHGFVKKAAVFMLHET